MLNTLRQADVEAIVEIEVAQLRVDLMALQEELRRPEEAWSRELVKLRANREVVLANLEKTETLRGAIHQSFKLAKLLPRPRLFWKPAKPDWRILQKEERSWSCKRGNSSKE